MVVRMRITLYIYKTFRHALSPFIMPHCTLLEFQPTFGIQLGIPIEIKAVTGLDREPFPIQSSNGLCDSAVINGEYIDLQ